MAEVRRIVLTNVESHLRSVTENVENVRRLQDEMETLMDSYSRELARYKAGELARDVYEDLSEQHRSKMGAINQRVSQLCREATAALRRAEAEVRENVPARRAAVRKTRKAARKRRK